MTRLIIPALIALLVSGPAWGLTDTYTGQFFVKNCHVEHFKSENEVERIQAYSCLAYIEAMSAMMFYMENYGVAPACIPPRASLAQLATVAVQYLRNIPSKWHEQGGLHIIESWGKTWPCPK